MLAYEVDGKQNLERLAEARDSLLPKCTYMRWSNIAHSQILGSLFPSWKLKGGDTLTARSATLESNEVAEVSDTNVEKVKSLGGEDPEIFSGIEGSDQSLSYIIYFANAVELYHKKNWNCFWCGISDHPVKDCLKNLSKTAWKVSLNVKEGAKEGRLKPSETSSHSSCVPRQAPRAWKHPINFPSWTLMHLTGGVVSRT